MCCADTVYELGPCTTVALLDRRPGFEPKPVTVNVINTQNVIYLFFFKPQFNKYKRIHKQCLLPSIQALL